MEGHSQKKDALTEAETPKKNNYIFTAFILAGVGYNLPNYCLTSAVDYYQDRYPDTTIIFDMVAIKHGFYVFGFLLNNILVESLNLKWRILCSYIAFASLMTFITVCDVTLELFSYDVSYAMPLLVIAVTSVALAVQQSSFYGYANMLPSKYTQAVAIGESMSGVVTSAARILTKLLLKDERINTIIFYTVADLTIILCCVVFIITRRTRFVTFYIDYCQSEKARRVDDVHNTNHLSSAEDEPRSITQTEKPNSQYGSTNRAPSGSSDIMTEQIIKRENSELPNISGTDNSPYPLPGGDNIDQREDSVKQSINQRDNDRELIVNAQRHSKIKGMLQCRWKITKQIYPFMISLVLVYFMTVSLFPGIVTEIESCSLGTWLPVILMAVFNLADTFGRVCASFDKFHTWLLRFYLIGPAGRFCFFPLILLCCLPRQFPIISGETWSVVIVLLFAFSNGLFIVLPLSQAPTHVAPKDREMCGNMMMTSVMCTILIGTTMSYVLVYSTDLHSTHANCTRTWTNLTAPIDVTPFSVV